MPHTMLVSVYIIPGGEQASLQAYDDLTLLLEQHEDVLLPVYRGMNRADGQWVITLIGEQACCARYQEQIQQPLERVGAKLISVPLERLVPLIEHFLEREAEMEAKQLPVLVKHSPLEKKDYKKNTSSKQQKRRKKQH